MDRTVGGREKGRLRELRTLLAQGGSSYAGADQANATRLVAVICSLSSLLALAFLPLDPPTERIGAGGWVVAAGLIAAGLFAGAWLRRRRRRQPPPYLALLSVSYAGLVAVAVLSWIAGDQDSAYRELTLLWIGSATGIHPLRRALPFLGVVTALTWVPALLEDLSAAEAADMGADYLLWMTLGVVMLGLMSYIRAQRVELRREERVAQELARADELTGLGNRRAFDEAITVELGRSRRAGSVTSLGLIDLDRFKEINDRFGHLEGDRCLRDTAAAITDALRAGDRAFRWAGDEFAVVLPDTGLAGARQVLSRVSDEVLRSCATAEGTPLSVSTGVAEAQGDMDATELLGRADLALFARKREKLEA